MRSRRVDSTVFFMAKTAPTKPETAQKRRPPKTGWHGRSQPTTPELSRTHITMTTHNHTTMAPSSTHPTTHIHTIRKYKSSHPRLRLRITRTHTTKITPRHQSRKTSPISRIVESFT